MFLFIVLSNLFPTTIMTIIKERYYENDYINITSKLIDQDDVQKYTYTTVIKLLEDMINNNKLDEFDK